MALETERKHLDLDVVRAGVAALLHKEDFGFYLVAEVSAGSAGSCLDVVGCLMVTYEWSDWRNGLQWWIQSVYVRPDARRQGVFRRLYRHVRTLVEADEAVCGLRLYVEKDNEIAQQTYRSLGMSETPYKVFEFEAGEEC